jgi:hypothetical protein
VPQIYDTGPTALLPFRRKACLGFCTPEKNPTASAGFEHELRKCSTCLGSLYRPGDDPDKGRNIVAKAKYIYTWKTVVSDGHYTDT